MRKLLFIVLLAALPVAARAQDCSSGTPCSVSGNASQVATFTRARTLKNTATCASVGLSANCTQTQARALNPNLNIYTDNQDYLVRSVVANAFQDLSTQVTVNDAAAFCVGFKAANQTTKDSICTATGQSAGCAPCP